MKQTKLNKKMYKKNESDKTSPLHLNRTLFSIFRNKSKRGGLTWYRRNHCRSKPRPRPRKRPPWWFMLTCQFMLHTSIHMLLESLDRQSIIELWWSLAPWLYRTCSSISYCVSYIRCVCSIMLDYCWYITLNSWARSALISYCVYSS